MREILFRGQTRRKGEKVYVGTGKPVDSNWVYGGVFQGQGDFSIIYGYKPIEKYTVYSDTVGQFTGLTDKNGKKIFEGDIVKGYFGYGDDENDIAYIEYQEDSMAFVLVEILKEDYGKCFEIIGDLEVIGNIYDNPELLGE